MEGEDGSFDPDHATSSAGALAGLEDATKKWPRSPLPDIDTAVDDLGM